MAKEIKQNVKIVQEQNKDEITVEVLAQSIEKIADGMKVFLDSRLKMRTIEHLISWQSGVGIVETRKVLGALTDLRKSLLK